MIWLVVVWLVLGDMVLCRCRRFSINLREELIRIVGLLILVVMIMWFILLVNLCFGIRDVLIMEFKKIEVVCVVGVRLIDCILSCYNCF